jgi:hypothetical protein
LLSKLRANHALLARLRAAFALAREPIDGDARAIDQRVLLVFERHAHQARGLVHHHHVGINVEDVLGRKLGAAQPARVHIDHDLAALGHAGRDLGDGHAVDAHLAAPHQLPRLVPAATRQLAHPRIEHASSGGRQNADIPVISWPTINVWMSCVPSYV